MNYRQEVGNNSRQGVPAATHLSSYSSLKSLFHANYLLTAGESGIRLTVNTRCTFFTFLSVTKPKPVIFLIENRDRMHGFTLKVSIQTIFMG
jgi:hypothetical protein